jgi:hypothetical protein
MLSAMRNTPRFPFSRLFLRKHGVYPGNSRFCPHPPAPSPIPLRFESQNCYNNEGFRLSAA